jgi:ABC-type branched-subunit amino acid transport system ATPase component
MFNGTHKNGIKDMLKQRISPIQANFGDNSISITFATADRIVVLENGVVKESGRPVELKSSNVTFAAMVRRQMEMTGGEVTG